MEYDRDVMVRLIVKKTQGVVVYDAMRNQSTDFPVITCALSQLNGTYKAVIGARPKKAEVYYDTQNRLQDGLNQEAICLFAQDVAGIAETSSNVRGSKEYRTHLIKVYIERGLEKLGGTCD